MEFRKIVIVEDNLAVRAMIKMVLEAKGNSVAGMASSGEDAISLVDATNPDLILMDIWLGGDMDGIETALQIRRFHKTPLVFITADYSEDTRKRANLANPHAYLKKPLMNENLEQIIQSLSYNSASDVGEVDATVGILCKA